MCVCVCITTIKGERATNLKENKKGYMRGFSQRNDIIVS